MKLLKPLPPGRTLEQVQNHYLVEKELAERLKKASRLERKAIYATMYDELFRQVPDHPRLTRREDTAKSQKSNRAKGLLVDKFLHPATVFVEFGAGDCRFALEVAKRVKQVYAVDISAQEGNVPVKPSNFSLIVYDGYELSGIPEDSVDVVFSDQLIEHIHPEDTYLHFLLIYRLLKTGGVYVFRTPHAQSGPHDVSQYFSEVAQGFHLKEWTYHKLKQLFQKLNYARCQAFWCAKGIRIYLPYCYFEFCEAFLARLPFSVRRRLARYLIPTIYMVWVK